MCILAHSDDEYLGTGGIQARQGAEVVTTSLLTVTRGEREILHLIAAGLSNQAIADHLVVAVSTVKQHVNNIYGKLDVQSRTRALLRAHELKLL